MALDCRCHRSAEGEYALLRCVLLRTRCVWALARAWFGEGVWVGFGFYASRRGWCVLGFCLLRERPRFVVSDGGLVLAFARASAHCLRAGIRALPSRFTRCPCAGRHLLFFAAAKKSRQKKAAHTANPCSCLRAPNQSYASNGNAPARLRCQRSLCTPHLLHAPASQHTAPDRPPPPRWQTVCRLSRHTRITPDGKARSVSLVRAPTFSALQPTHSLPPGRQRPFAAASPAYGCLKRVRLPFKALATSANGDVAV